MSQKRMKSEGATSGLYGGWVRSVHMTFVISTCFKTYVASFVIVLKGENGNFFLRSKSIETLLRGFKDLNLHILFSGLKAWHNIE